jgi:hypothetical protein
MRLFWFWEYIFINSASQNSYLNKCLELKLDFMQF